jgi:hypothetical protein
LSTTPKFLGEQEYRSHMDEMHIFSLFSPCMDVCL